MKGQLDLFSGTEFEKPKPVKKIDHSGPIKKSGFTQSEEDAILDFARRWECSGARHSLENDLLKFKDGKRVEQYIVAEYHALIKKVMRNMGINAKYYIIDGYGTTKMGIVTHNGAQCLKFNHRETGESIYVEL